LVYKCLKTELNWPKGHVIPEDLLFRGSTSFHCVEGDARCPENDGIAEAHIKSTKKTRRES